MIESADALCGFIFYLGELSVMNDREQYIALTAGRLRRSRHPCGDIQRFAHVELLLLEINILPRYCHRLFVSIIHE
jgi:hypothetical protein